MLSTFKESKCFKTAKSVLDEATFLLVSPYLGPIHPSSLSGIEGFGQSAVYF